MKLIYYLYFLYCIKAIFCYECITNEKAIRPLGPRHPNTKNKLERQKNPHRRTRRQEFEEEKDPVASIDIASFIQQPDPDYETIDDSGDYNNKRQQPNEDDLSSLNDLQMYLENNAKVNSELEDSNSQFDENSPDLTNLRQYDTQNLQEANSLDKKGNRVKISKRRQALPFFSRDDKEKKHKKRKLFNFGFRSTSMTTLLPKFDGFKSSLSNHSNKLVKRSNTQRFCPLCKRRILPKTSKQKKMIPSRKNVHNSRQYYQTLEEVGSNKQKKAVSNNDFQNINNFSDNKKPGVSGRNYREKRDYEEVIQDEIKNLQPTKRDHNDVRDRQLKELEEVQRKVDNLEIPTIHIYPTQKTDNKNFVR